MSNAIYNNISQHWTEANHQAFIAYYFMRVRAFYSTLVNQYVVYYMILMIIIQFFAITISCLLSSSPSFVRHSHTHIRSV